MFIILFSYNVIVFSLARNNFEDLSSVLKIDFGGDEIGIIFLENKRSASIDVVPNVMGHVVVPDLIFETSVFENDEVFVESLE